MNQMGSDWIEKRKSEPERIPAPINPLQETGDSVHFDTIPKFVSCHPCLSARVLIASRREPRLEEVPVGGESNKLKGRLGIQNLAAFPGLGYGRSFGIRYAGVRESIHEESFRQGRTVVRNASICGRPLCRDAAT